MYIYEYIYTYEHAGKCRYTASMKYAKVAGARGFTLVHLTHHAHHAEYVYVDTIAHRCCRVLQCAAVCCSVLSAYTPRGICLC